MAKFYGAIGYVESVETTPGVYTNREIERNYSGDILENISRWSSSTDSTNDDLTISNQFSIVSDPYAVQNFHSIKYIVFMGTKWKITNIKAQYPRLILTVGGVYNG